MKTGYQPDSTLVSELKDCGRQLVIVLVIVGLASLVILFLKPAQPPEELPPPAIPKLQVHPDPEPGPDHDAPTSSAPHELAPRGPFEPCVVVFDSLTPEECFRQKRC